MLMKDLDVILFHFIYLFIFWVEGGRRVGGKNENFHICQNTKMGAGVLNLRQKKCDNSLIILPILINKVFYMELHTP